MLASFRKNNFIYLQKAVLFERSSAFLATSPQQNYNHRYQTIFLSHAKTIEALLNFTSLCDFMRLYSSLPINLQLVAL
jgi:hypothetical protein